uniref:A kinase-anchoring proteins AKAP-5 and AKAP-12 calmodulin (CaM)-binding domain-containing protein n=1 Tax=Oryzias latipes TaxID=8090 RepID=A0A3B3H6V9_ORYLA
MGDAQSAQREDRGEAAAAEQEAPSDTKETPLRNNGQISELHAKADESKEELNGLREEVLPQVSVVLPPKDASEEEEEQEVPMRNDEEDEAHEEDTKEMEAKQNDLNEGFKKFFSSISLKLTVKRGSVDRGETERPPTEEEPGKPEGGREPPVSDGEQVRQEAPNESSSYQTPVDQTSADFPGKPDENTTETKEEVPASADEEPPPLPSSPDDKDTPFKKFFSTGLFSGLKKKKKSTDDEVTEKELMDLRRKKAAEQEVIPGVEVTAAEEEPEENQAADEAQTAASQEKVQSSPLKRLLSGSSFKRSSKKQRGRRSSDSRLSISGEHGADIQSSTESAEIQKEEAPAQPCSDPPPAEEGAWSSFKKLVTPQKLRKKSEDTSASVEAAKAAEGEPASEEGPRRKDSSVSWEAVLCGSGRRRSRKTSDEEEETPQADVEKQETEEAPGGPNEASAEDEGSTWRSFKKLVTPKRKAKDDEEEGKNAAQSEEALQEESPFSVKKLLSGQKNRRSVEKQAAPAEADLEEPAGEDETPAVVPLSEFDQEGTEDQVPEEADAEPQQDLPLETEKLLPPEGQQAKEILDEASGNEGSEAPRTVEELEDLSDENSDLQALSDIPEEGVATEGAELDDTLAEKLVELTSEAITAPEPTDFTLTEETEMVSAVSQFSESSETSENATPVPAEGALLDMEMSLQEVSQTTSTSPEAVQGPPEEQSSERSASIQILGETADPHGQVLNDLETQNLILGSGDAPETSPTEEPSSPEPDADEVQKVQLSESIEAPEGDYHLEECAAKAPEEESETFPEEEERPGDAVMDQSEEEHPDEAASPEQIQILPDSKVQTTEDLSEETPSGQADDPEAASRDDPSVMVPPEADAEEPREEPETTEETDQADVTAQPHLEEDTTPPPEDTLMESEEPKTAAQRLTEETPEPEDEGADAAQTDVSEAAEIQEVKGDDASGSENDVETPSSEDAPSPEGVPGEPEQSEQHLTVGPNEEDNRDPDVLHGEISTASEVQEAAKVCLVESSEDVPPEKDSEEPKLSEGAEEETPEMDQGAPPSHDLQSAEGDSDEPEQTAEQENKEPEPDVPEKDFSEAQQTSGLQSEESRVQSLMEDLVEEDLCPSETAEEPRLEPGVLPSVHVEPENTAEAILLDPGEEEEPVCEDLESEPQIHQDLPDRRAAAAEEGVLPPDAQPENVPPPEGTGSPAEKETAEQTLKIPHPHRAQAELQDSPAEAVQELPASSALHVSSINQEPSIAWLLEKTTCPQTSAGESAQVSAEAFWETKICAVEERLEGGAAAELPASEARAAVTVDAAAMEVASCSLRETLLKKPHLLLHEPLIGVLAGEEEFSSTVETTAPLEADRSSESAQAASTVQMMHMPTVEYEENHRIQVQVKDVDVRWAQRSVESLVELGVTESREVIDVCHECIQRVEKLSAASHTEEEVINEVAEVTFHEVVQEIQGHFKQDEAGTRLSFEEVVYDLETTAPLEGDRISASAEESSTVLMMHAPTVEPEDSMEHDHRHLEEHLEKQVPPGDATAEEPARAELSAVQTRQNQIAAQPSSRSNLGLISSIGNVEPPSSLSLEFKLNIQFGQVTPPAPPAGRVGAVQQADSSESEAQNQNSSEAAESSTRSPKRAALQDVGIQAMEPVEEVQTTERRAPSVQAADAVSPLGPKDKRSIFLGKPEPSQPKPEEAPKQSDEDNDQEVWLDAEEDIYSQEDPQGSSGGPHQQEPADELRGRSQTGPGAAERPSETLKPAGASDLDSEGEDFAVALEDLESRAAPADED